MPVVSDVAAGVDAGLLLSALAVYASRLFLYRYPWHMATIYCNAGVFVSICMPR